MFICNNMLYHNGNLIKHNKLDLAELYWSENNEPIRGNDDFWSDYEFAKKRLYEFIETYKNYQVVWYEVVEGTDYRFTNPNIYKFFIDYYKKTNKKIIFKTNSLNTNYDDNVIYYPCFGFMGSVKSYRINPRKFTKKILFLNRVERWHRTQLYYEFKNKNLLKYMDYSINAEDSSLIPFKSIEVDEVETKNIMDILPNYFTTFLSLITETHFNNGDEQDNVLFFTEKLEKVIAVGHPFIIVSIPGYIKTLKKIGFKTFDKWWDESYDDIENESKRLDYIIDIVDFICKKDISELEKMYIEMIPILKHNQKLTKYIGNLSTEWVDYTLDDIVMKVKNEFL